MFMLPRSIYDEWPKWWTMTDSPLNGSRTRNAGAMEPLYWSPGSPIFEMTSEDALKLPRFAIEICRVPHLAGRDLVSEHPASATSWRIKGAVRASSRRCTKSLEHNAHVPTQDDDAIYVWGGAGI